MLDITKIKKDFPIFSNIPDLVYLDSTATSLKPKEVIEAEINYYDKYSANIYRGVYKISEKATYEYEETRKTVAKFIGAKNPNEIIFTRNTTESINLIAYSLGREIVKEGDEVVTTIMEHHSNFVPWQQLAFENGATFKVADIDDEGNLVSLENVVTKKTKILALTYVSNVLGTINPLGEIIKRAKKINPKIIIIIDGAQAVPHFKLDVRDLGCDFFVFSSHKMLGPTGVGVLWGRYSLLEKMFPFNFGGEMIAQVALDKTTYKDPPQKFEAGTPAIAQVIALKSAIFYLNRVGLDNIRRHEKELSQYTLNRLRSVFDGNIKILGPKEIESRGGTIAFSFKNYHPHDIAQILDEKNICIRAGHHCAMPLHRRLGVNASARMSFYIYNDKEDIDRLVTDLKKVDSILKK